jgi:hypothetical protein
MDQQNKWDFIPRKSKKEVSKQRTLSFVVAAFLMSLDIITLWASLREKQAYT